MARSAILTFARTASCFIGFRVRARSTISAQRDRFVRVIVRLDCMAFIRFEQSGPQ